MTISYEYRYNAQSARFSFIYCQNIKESREHRFNFIFIRKTAFTWKRNMVFLSLIHIHSLSLHGKSLLKTMVSLQMLKEKWSLFTVKICSVKVLEEMDKFFTGSSCDLSHSHPHTHYELFFYSTATTQQTFKCTSHQVYCKLLSFFLFRPSEIRVDSVANLVRTSEGKLSASQC